MKKSQLREVIRSIIKKQIAEAQPAPDTKPTPAPTITPDKPSTEPDEPKRRRIGRPDVEPKPKALSEQDILNKIVSRYKNKSIKEDKNDDKISKYEQYIYTLDGKVVKPEIDFYNNILKAELNGNLYRIGEPINGKIELKPIKGKTGMYTENKNKSKTNQLNEMGGPVPRATIDIKYIGAPNNINDEKIQKCTNEIKDKVQNILKSTFNIPVSFVDVKFNEK